jgi:hypothetical protein
MWLIIARESPASRLVMKLPMEAPEPGSNEGEGSQDREDQMPLPVAVARVADQVKDCVHLYHPPSGVGFLA